MRQRGVAGALLGAAILVVACGADDRELRPPSPNQTTTSTTAAPVSGSDVTSTLPLGLASPAFGAGAVIPERHTCRAEDLAPPLQWANLPAGVTELAVVVRDLDANGFVHWVVAGISPAAGELTEGQLPEGAQAYANDFGRIGWAGPCPPSGTHRYEFRLYALSGIPSLATGMDAKAAAQAVESTPAISVATLIGTVAAV